MTRKYQRERARIAARRLLGSCVRCGLHQPLEHQEVCRLCYLKRVALQHLGSRKRWKELIQLWREQQGRCYYTDRPLRLGYNASIDHLIPRSTSPQTEFDIKNIKWVLWSVNQAKGIKPEWEFERSFTRTCVAFLEKRGLFVSPVGDWSNYRWLF